MPRAARLDIAGVLQLVIVRGVERRDIFLDDDDRQSFLDRFPSLLLQTETECLAWSLMTNHVHMLLRPSQGKLGHFMRRLLKGHAVTFNLRQLIAKALGITRSGVCRGASRGAVLVAQYRGKWGDFEQLINISSTSP
jgi:REP element-mobilizing transposase RayT